MFSYFFAADIDSGNSMGNYIALVDRSNLGYSFSRIYHDSSFFPERVERQNSGADYIQTRNFVGLEEKFSQGLSILFIV